ncbi:signal transduction histidine kinase [Parabacteroides sp. PFB2-10]|uniref:sensor histidine kinase n=1 Tax=Parabacteroides sp. PFB2-10 TaxID=1742405 RepID=UPI002474018F|nr:HAMP domain-containing sensor histidine kinase [Parabacteroides sp. PFB2-10]MDH6312134.1 signal transduction histidine kinase [Parabacteroides sp. PFB2-10]
MTTEKKIALTYTGIIGGSIALLALLSFVMACFLLPKGAGSEAESSLIPSLLCYVAIMLVGFVVISSLLVYLVSRRYTARMIERIDTAFQSEKAFVRNASHELNNPLTAIQGECEITLLKERTPEEYQAAISRILHETKRIIHLMKQLLFLSRGHDEILQSFTESIQIAEFMMSFVGGRVRFSPDSFAYSVKANPHLLKIAIENILSNALKYSDTQPVEVRLRVNELEIEDYGIGIPPDELGQIFQPFFRASNTRGFAGYGVGLALSLRVLQTYGAKISVYSELGKGTRVKIIFP